MEELAVALRIGLTNGLIIAVIAIGYTLVYGILELINFAHADVFMFGTLFTYLGLEPRPCSSRSRSCCRSPCCSRRR